MGVFKDGIFEGENAEHGIKYFGEYKNGTMNGRGTYTFADGTKYVGEYRDGNYNGQGTYTFANGQKYVGEFRDSKRNGQGGQGSLETLYGEQARTDIASVQAEVGDIEGALTTTELMDEEFHYRDLALAKIASAQARAGDVDGALVTAAPIDWAAFYWPLMEESSLFQKNFINVLAQSISDAWIERRLWIAAISWECGVSFAE